jgi:hypothetical protein
MGHRRMSGIAPLLAIMAAFRESGIAMCVPFGENTRSDLTPEDGHRVLRVQCKSGRSRRLQRSAGRFASRPATRSREFGSRQHLARILVLDDLALHTLEGVVDRLRVAAELLAHLLV